MGAGATAAGSNVAGGQAYNSGQLWFRMRYRDGRLSAYYGTGAAGAEPTDWKLIGRDLAAYVQGATGAPPTVVNLYSETYAAPGSALVMQWDNFSIVEL